MASPAPKLPVPGASVDQCHQDSDLAQLDQVRPGLNIELSLNIDPNAASVDDQQYTSA